MALDKSQVEQEALAFLNRGQLDKALARYNLLLRADPKDRRIRQKVAELCLRTGRRADAERLLREQVESLVTDGQHKAAISVIKQLVELNPRDSSLEAQLGAAYHKSGYGIDARRHYERAIQRLRTEDPQQAVVWQRELVRLAPNEQPLLVQLAELLEGAGQIDVAIESYANLALEARRRGRPDDAARFLEMALKLRPDDPDLLIDAADARVAQGEHRTALLHLQKATVLDPGGLRGLTLLAAALEGTGLKEKAGSVWEQVARAAEEMDQPAARLHALERAVACGVSDPLLRAALGEAQADSARRKMRLLDVPWAEPDSDAEVRVVTRARTLLRYGFADRAKATLTGAPPPVREALASRVLLAETLVDLGDLEAALGELRAVRVIDADGRVQLGTRLDVLHSAVHGEPDELPEIHEIEELVDEALIEELTDPGFGAQRPPPGPEPVEDEPTADSEPVSLRVAVSRRSSGPAEEGDRLAARGDRDGALAAWRRALNQDPTNEEVLLKISELLASDAPTVPPMEPPSLSFSDPFAATPPLFSGVDERELASFPTSDPAVEIDEDEEDPRLGVARGYLAVEMWRQALATAIDARDSGQPLNLLLAGGSAVDLPSRVLAATALHGLGESAQAAALLREALSEAGENDAGYLDALLVVARLSAVTRKGRAALRLLAELEDLDPSWRADEVADLRRGIELLEDR